MKKITSYIIFCLLPALSFGQWNQLGNDINGTTIGDELGSTNSTDIDSAGTTIAFGTPFNGDVFPFSGYAKVMDWDGTNWTQRGNTFVGIDASLEGTGAAVSLSADGNTVAISSPWGYNSLGYKCGIVRVFDWDGTDWILRGDRIDGEGNIVPLYNGDVFGIALELSSDGNYIAIGGKGNTKEIGVQQFTGHARAYHWDGTAWTQMGLDIDGDINGGIQEFGGAVSISDDGQRIAVGGRMHSGIIQNSGFARMFEFDGSDWVQMGDTLFGTSQGENFGSAVQLTRDGNSVAIGAPSANGTYVGATNVFDWDGSNWVLRGLPIDAVGTGSSNSGISIDLSFDGKIIAIGESWVNFNNGRVRLFQWNGTAWQQLGNSVIPSGPSIASNGFGSSVRINAIGSRIVVGAPSNDDLVSNSGEITVHENETVVGIDELTNINVRLFPNPSNGITTISADEQIQTVTIVNSMGQEIIQLEGSSNDIDLDLSKQPTGIYMAKVQTQKSVQILPLIKN